MSKLFTNCLERKVHTLSEMDDKIGMSKAIRSTRPAAYISCLGAVLAPVGLIDKSTQKSKGLTVVSGTNYTFVSVAVLVLGVILSIAMAATSVTRYLGNVAQNAVLQARVEELQPARAVYNEYLAAEASMINTHIYMLIPRLPMRIWWSSSMNWNRSCRTASIPTASAPTRPASACQ